MGTIIYEGQEIEVQHVSDINLRLGDGMDTLLCDKEGCYYLRREFADKDTVLLHRINVNAAILWAVEIGAEGSSLLRSDAASLLMEGRGYFDPNPIHCPTVAKGEMAEAAKPLPISRRVSLSFELEPLHAALLSAFSRRQGIAHRRTGRPLR
jgi:hypothetical protein